MAQGQSTKKLKPNTQSIVAIGAITVLLGGMLWAIGRFQIEVWVEEPGQNRLPPEPSALDAIETGMQPSPVASSPVTGLPSTPSPTPMASDPPSSAVARNDLAAAQATSYRGKLRVSNRTEAPIRVALLPHRPQVGGIQASNYTRPVHWDFAPAEGSQQGLILSLPEGNLSLNKGDVLVAFAQDGSRLYWGPYVVGETNLPTWDQKNSEWQLILSP